MVVGGQYDRGGGPSDFSFSIFQMFCQSQVFYSETMCFDFVVKQYVLFNNPRHFCVMVGMLKNMKKREMCDVSLGN